MPSETLPVTATVLSSNHADCVNNTAPENPGRPELAPGSVTPNNTGTFTITWAAATDAQGDALVYTLERKNASGSWGFVDDKITTNVYEFTNLGESSWVFRVKASDGSLSSDYSIESNPVKVDKSGPNAPTASFNPATAPYNDGTNNWYKSVTVSYSGNGDPNLTDGSAGSGVASHSTAESFPTTGAHFYSGTVTDYARNESSATSGTVKVDATVPVATLTLPADNAIYLVGQIVKAGFSCSDNATGDSGLKASGGCVGTVANGADIDTSSAGVKTFTVNAEDNVGNTSQVTRTYTVYNFVGFENPVNSKLLNTAKAGRVIPLKWRLTDAAGNGINTLSSATVKAQVLTCGSVATPTDPVDEYAAGSSGLQNLGDGYYQVNWQTDKGWANACRTISLDLGGSGMMKTLSVNFRFER